MYMEEMKKEEEEERVESINDHFKCSDDGEGEGGGGGGLRVLVVDDSPIDRTIVERLLKKCGDLFEVITVDSGKKAMEVLGLDERKTDIPSANANERSIDIILTDYCMPEMTGYDLLKAIKEHSCPKSIPVVIMSSENEPQRITRCRAIGAEDFILKPLQTKDVRRLKDYARPPVQSPKAGSKRKLPLDLIGESGSSETRPCLTGVAVA